MLRAFGATFGGEVLKFCKDYKRAVLRQKGRNGGGNAAVVFGAVCGILGLEDKEAAQGYLYTQVRDAVSACVRMNIMGPLEGAGIIREIMEEVGKIIDKEVREGGGGGVEEEQGVGRSGGHHRGGARKALL